MDQTFNNLILPLATLLALLIVGIEPPVDTVLSGSDYPNLLGMLILLGSFLLAIAAGLISREPIVHTTCRGCIREQARGR